LPETELLAQIAELAEEISYTALGCVWVLSYRIR
jgi:hypothetical protein